MVYSYTGGLYFAKYVLRNEGLYSLITLLVVPGGLVASVLVPWMTKKFTKKNKPIHRNELINSSDYDIIMKYNLELRGLYNYYTLSQNVSGLNKLKYIDFSLHTKR